MYVYMYPFVCTAYSQIRKLQMSQPYIFYNVSLWIETGEKYPPPKSYNSGPEIVISEWPPKINGPNPALFDFRLNWSWFRWLSNVKSDTWTCLWFNLIVNYLNSQLQKSRKFFRIFRIIDNSNEILPVFIFLLDK